MSTIGNTLAFGILILISIVFLRTKYYLTKASEYYRVCLILTFATAILNTSRFEIAKMGNAPKPVLIGLTTVEFLLVLILTSMMALYLVSKVTEHVMTKNTLLFAKIYLAANTFVFSCAVLANIPFKYIFHISEDGSFIDGVISYLPYFILIPQFALVAIYCIKCRKTLNRKVLFALFESVLAICFTFGLKMVYNISVLVLTLSLIQLIFFLDFQRQKMGVHSITKLNDGRSFFSEVERRKKKKKHYKVYIIFIENIGIVKQNHGQKIGDEALYRFATALSRLFVGGLAFHMYGTTFTLMLDTVGSERDTEKLLEFLDGEIALDNLSINFDYLAAENVWDEDESSADAFYERLEYAAEMARQGHLKFKSYTLETEISRLREKYLISRMQNISVGEGFEIWFQPIFSNRKECFTSVEVLLRLKEKNGSYISPAEFIPIAEKTGQIRDITWFVLERTCHVLAETPALDGIRASINLPMLHLVDPTFEDRLNSVVDKYKIPHERISFEFTERVILDDLDVAERNMRRLAKSGYSFYLDDFGVGYSNFNCVLRLPLRTVKLDMTLTSTTETLAENRNLVCILTDLFHDMGLTVVAEGAENAEQVKLLRSFGVDGIQGYYYAKPMPFKNLCTFLEKKNAQ